MQQNEVTITLENAIKRGETEIKSLLVRKPKSGALRGLNMRDIIQMDVDTVGLLCTRICEPPLTQQEVAQIEPFDLLQIGANMAGFFTQTQTEAKPAEVTEKHPESKEATPTK